jgi:hypothetical protein
MTSHDAQIRSLLAVYETSLNASDAELAASCYTSDGVFMPTTLPTAGGDGLREAYVAIFNEIRLDRRGHGLRAYSQPRYTDDPGYRRPERRVQPRDLPLPPGRHGVEDRPLHV